MTRVFDHGHESHTHRGPAILGRSQTTTDEEAMAIGRSCGMTTAETAVARIVSR